MRNPRNISLQAQSGGGGDTFDSDDILLSKYAKDGSLQIEVVCDKEGNLVLKG